MDFSDKAYPRTVVSFGSDVLKMEEYIWLAVNWMKR